MSVSVDRSSSSSKSYASFLAVVFLSVFMLVGLSGCFHDDDDDDVVIVTPEDYIIRISVNSSGEEGNGLSYKASSSSDGRYVVFESEATNLVAGDTNDVNDIFIRDTKENTTQRVSVDTNGVQGDGASLSAMISDDGLFVVFQSSASNLVENDTNGFDDIFVRDLVNQTTFRVSIVDGVSGVEGNGDSSEPSISGDGGVVAFNSDASNFVSDTNNKADIFVRDLVNNTLVRVSIGSGSDGEEGDNGVIYPIVSLDGNTVAFSSLATNLVENDTNGKHDIFFRNLTTLSTERVSITSDGVQGNRHSLRASLSANANVVSFDSKSIDFVEGSSNGVGDVFVLTVNTGSIIRVSVDSMGNEADDLSFFSDISDDGNIVTFTSNATNLVSNDTNNLWDVFVHTISSGKTVRVSVNENGEEGDDNSGLVEDDSFTKVILSANGKYALFSSKASNLVANDTNIQSDVFRVVISQVPEESN